MADTLADRIRTILDYRGWSARQLGREAGINETSIGLIIKRFDADPHASIETKTARALAQAAGCSVAWLELGEGEPNWTEPSTNDTDGPAPAAREAVSDPPATYESIPGYDALERAARRIARDVEAWVWAELRVSNPLRNSRVPLTPSSLAAIAKLIAEHGVPPVAAAPKPTKRA